jgi:hypothetical protein
VVYVVLFGLEAGAVDKADPSTTEWKCLSNIAECRSDHHLNRTQWQSLVLARAPCQDRPEQLLVDIDYGASICTHTHINIRRCIDIPFDQSSAPPLADT